MSGFSSRLLPANTTLLQPGSKYYRVSDALNAQSSASTTNTNTNASLQTQINDLQSQINALAGAVYSQVFSDGVQDTSVSITVPNANRGIRITLRANPGSFDAGGTSYSASGYLYRDGTIIGQVGYINSAGPPAFPAPPNFPWGDVDQPGAGSHTYQMNFYVDPEIAAATGTSNWSDYASTANCYILVEVF